jgi:hypothetical protein
MIRTTKISKIMKLTAAGMVTIAGILTLLGIDVDMTNIIKAATFMTISLLPIDLANIKNRRQKNKHNDDDDDDDDDDKTKNGITGKTENIINNLF